MIFFLLIMNIIIPAELIIMYPIILKISGNSPKNIIPRIAAKII